MKCHYCGTQSDLRPYGPKGAPICFDCMKADPERELEAKRNLLQQLEAAGPHPVIGLNVGPIPLKSIIDENGDLIEMTKEML